MSKWLSFGAQPASSSAHRRSSSSSEATEAFCRLFQPSNASSTTENNIGIQERRRRPQTPVLGHERRRVDREPRSVDDSGLFFADEWEVLDEEGNPLPAGDDEHLGSPGVEDSFSKFAPPEALGDMDKLDCMSSKWEDAGSTHSFLVRGPTYLMDKIKRPAGAAMCRLVGVDCFVESDAGCMRIDHIASRGSCRERVRELTSGDDPLFLFIMNIQVGGTPTVSLVVYWAVDRRALHGATEAPRTPRGSGDAAAGARGQEPKGQKKENVTEKTGFAEMFARYANIPLSSFGGEACSLMDPAPPRAPSDERNRRFKLIPRVISGPWMMRKAIGSTPVLLGTKIHHRYYRGDHYIETDLDTASSAAAAALCSRCRWVSRNLDVELGIVLQANAPQELPEALLGAVRLNCFGVEDPGLQKKLFAS